MFYLLLVIDSDKIHESASLTIRHLWWLISCDMKPWTGKQRPDGEGWWGWGLLCLRFLLLQQLNIYSIWNQGDIWLQKCRLCLPSHLLKKAGRRQAAPGRNDGSSLLPPSLLKVSGPQCLQQLTLGKRRVGCLLKTNELLKIQQCII